MFWIILTIIGVLMIVWGSCRDTFSNLDEFPIGFGFFVFIIFGFISGVVVIKGSTCHVELLEQQKRIEVYSSRMVDIKASTYNKRISKNVMISGSLENFKHSTTLADYIIKLTTMEAEYNASLLRYRYYEDWWVAKVFMYGAFIDESIQTLGEYK